MRPWLLGVGVALIVVAAALEARRRWLQRAAQAIDAQIVPLAKRHYRYTGIDEGARRRSEARRADADRKVRDAGKIRTRDDASALLHKVG